MADVTDLQLAINRFAGVGAAEVLLDGVVTPALGASLLSALAWIHANLDGVTNTASGLMAKLQAADGTIDTAQITASASGLAQYLNDNADLAGLPAGSGTAPPGPISPLLANVNVLGLNLPKWVVYGGAALVVIGGIAIAVKNMRAA